MHFRKAVLGLLAIVALAALALPALAQETTTGTLEGRVTDDKGGTVPGATISVTGSQGLQATRTGTDGRFSIPFLRPGSYEVRVEAAGFATIIIKDVSVQINRRTNLPVQVSSGKVETVTVEGAAPMIDRKSTSVGESRRLGEFVNYIPIGRTYSDTFATVPGVVSGGGPGAGNFSISGASGLENQYIVDGVNITNTGYGGIGSFNAVYGSLGTGVTTDFLEEVQVKTGGFEPEFGGATGGILNTVVKGGTNDFSGSAGFYFTPRSLQANERDVSLAIGAVNYVDEQVYDLGLSVGGPIVKDKLFYFLAYNPVRRKSRFAIESAQFDARFAPPGISTFPAALLGNQEQTRTSQNWAAKLTWKVSSNHNLDLTGFGDPSLGKEGIQNTSSLRHIDFAQGGGQSEIRYGANNFALKYTGIFTPNFFGEVQVSRHKGKFRETPILEQSRVRDRRQQLCFLFPLLQSGALNCIGNRPSAPTTWFTGGPGFISNSDDINDNYAIKATNILGPLEIKYGADVYDIRYTDRQAYSGTPVDFFIPVDQNASGTYEVGEGVTITSNSGTLLDQRSATNFRATRNRLNPFPGPTTTKDLNGFAQATWSISPAWVLKGGVRVTRQKITGSGGQFDLPFVLDPSGLRVAGTTSYQPSEYKFPTVWSPRLGVTWDVTGDGRSKAYANVGRYFERIPNDLAVRALSTEIGTQVYRFNSLGPDNVATSPDPQTNPNSAIFFSGLDPTRVQDSTKLPYKDEAILGYAYQIRPNLSVEVRGIYRKQGRTLEDVQFTKNEQIQNLYYGVAAGYPFDPFGGSTGQPASTDFPAAPFGAYVLANPGENTPASSGFPEPKHEYKAVELIINKLLSDHWLMYANYRYSRLTGNYEGLYRNDNGQSDPNITSLFDFPDSPTMRGQFQEGLLNNDRPHVLNLYASYIWDNGFTLGGSVNWQSGIPRTPLLAHPNYQNSGEIPGRDPIYFWWSDNGNPDLDFVTGTASEFFNDANSVLPIPILFDYKDCERGCFGRTPDEVAFNVHAGYQFKIKDTRLDLALDIFNIFDSKEANAFNDNVESTAGIPDPDFGVINSYQPARSIRVNARWAF